MIPLCGQCRSKLRASTRWQEAEPAKRPTDPAMLAAHAIENNKPCVACGHRPLSSNFPHARFLTTLAELTAAFHQVRHHDSTRSR